MRTYYVYMVRCSDGKYYVGISCDYEKRIAEHNAGVDISSFTYTRRPVHLVYLAKFTEVHQAISWEKQIKRWGRSKKEALTRGEYEVLPGLALNAKQRRIVCIRRETRKRVMVRSLEP